MMLSIFIPEMKAKWSSAYGILFFSLYDTPEHVKNLTVLSY